MEVIYPEIALKQPKADPRTVLLHKRNFLESSSDHVQYSSKNSICNLTKINCDNSGNMCKFLTATTTATARKTALVSKTSSESVSPFLKSLSSSSLPSPSKLSAVSTSWSRLPPSLLLANFLKSCHLNASFTRNYFYKLQSTKFLFFLLFISCAIFLQTAQAVPLRRVTTSGRKHILHTNVYREHYHQKLLEEQRRHNQEEHLIQRQLQDQKSQLQVYPEQQQPELTPTSLSQLAAIHHQLQVQKDHIFLPSKTFGRYPPLPSHNHHHLHQRAAPVTLPHHYLQQYKMSYCNGNKIYQNLYQQMNASMLYIKQLSASYLRERGNETFDEMSETWKLITLETRNPKRKQVSIENELHKKIHEFYLNLHTFDQLIDYAFQDTNDNKTKIEHGEDISIDKIIKFLQSVKAEIKFNMKEAENLLDILEIAKPDLADNVVVFNSNIGRRIRDFLIIKTLIEEFQHVLHLVQNYCENNESE